MTDKQLENNENSTVNNQSISARTIWGRVVIYLREHGYTAMHIACGDITDVVKDDDQIKIKAEEQFLIDLLKREDNKKILEEALISFGINKYTIEKKEKQTDIGARDIEKLKAIFPNKLILK